MIWRLSSLLECWIFSKIMGECYKQKKSNMLIQEFCQYSLCQFDFPVWLWNRLLSAGLEPVLDSIELQTIFYEYQNKNHKIKTQFCQPRGAAAESCL